MVCSCAVAQWRRTGVHLQLAAIQRPHPIVGVGPGDHLPAQRARGRHALGGQGRACGGVAHVQQGTPLGGRRGGEAGQAIRRVQLAVRPVHLEKAAARVGQRHPFGHGIQDGVQLFGPLARLCLAGLCPRQRRLRLPPGVLLGGVEAGAVDCPCHAVTRALQQLHVRLGEAARGGAAAGEHPYQPAQRVTSHGICQCFRPWICRRVLHQQRHADDRA